MTTSATKPEKSFVETKPSRRLVRFGLFTLGLLVSAVIVLFCARWFFFAPPTLQPGDLLLLEPESIARVEAAAKAGDILAQTALGSAYLHGRTNLPKNVTEAVYWLRKVADRDHSQFEGISKRMQSLLEKSEDQRDLRKRSAMALDYLDLAARRLAFEAAILSLIEIYMGQHGISHVNAELAVRYMRLGATYGMPAAQRALGIVTRFGLLGVPKNEVAGTILLTEAAAKGDQVARKVLFNLDLYDRVISHAGMGTVRLADSFW